MLVVCVFVSVIFPLHVVLARHDENAAADTNHLDRRSVEARHDRAGDDFIDLTQCRVSVAQIEHAVERSKQRIEFMRAEQHRYAQFRLQRFRQMHDRALMTRIEADQGFVQQ